MYKQVYVPLKSNDQLLCDVIICVFAENRTKKQIYGVVFSCSFILWVTLSINKL